MDICGRVVGEGAAGRRVGGLAVGGRAGWLAAGGRAAVCPAVESEAISFPAEIFLTPSSLGESGKYVPGLLGVRSLTLLSRGSRESLF